MHRSGLKHALCRRMAFAAVTGAASAFAPAAGALAGETYYVSSTSGSDYADGLTPATAWKSLVNVNTKTFDPGTQVLFERGSEWREKLWATSSGTAEAPIVYGAYGSGAKPKFWGSNPVANNSFAKVGGTSSTYAAPVGQTVNSVLADHNFLSAAFMRTGSNDPAVNRAYVDANPNTWAYAGGQLYVNTGGANPAADGRLYTAAVRDDVVFSNFKDNLVFRDLVVDESAKDEAGYAFRVMHSANVRLENVEAYRAGKHHVGVINSTGFVGQGIYATSAMPDQGIGGASAFVSYSDQNRSGDNSAWVDCVAENLGDWTYLGILSHGPGLGNLLIQNMTGRNGAGIGVGTDVATTKAQVIGGHLENAPLNLWSTGALVDGLRLTGTESKIDIYGTDNTVQNVLMTGAKPIYSYTTAIMDRGMGNTLQYNTVILDPNSPAHATAFAVLSALTDTRLIGNIFETPDAVLRQWFQGTSAIQSDFNMYSPEARVILYYTWKAMADWQASGKDVNSLLSDPAFMDALAGDFRLADGSPGLDRIDFDSFAEMPGWDILGQARPSGEGYDLGAFEAAVPEPGAAALAAAAGGAVSLLRRRRRPARAAR